MKVGTISILALLILNAEYKSGESVYFIHYYTSVIHYYTSVKTL